MIDAFTRCVPALDVRERYTGADVVATLEQVRAEIGFPKSIRVDQGPEFVSKDLEMWAYARGVELDFSPRRCTASLCDDANRRTTTSSRA